MTTTDFTSAFSFVVADTSSEAGPSGSMFFNVFATHEEDIERKASNVVTVRRGEITSLVCRRHLCGCCAHFLLAISLETLAWDANFSSCQGLGASLVTLCGSLFVRLLRMDTVKSCGNKDSRRYSPSSTRRSFRNTDPSATFSRLVPLGVCCHYQIGQCSEDILTEEEVGWVALSCRFELDLLCDTRIQ